MKKKVKLSLETAKELFKQGGASKSFALDNFSEEDLTKNELSKSWEELGAIGGYFLNSNCDVRILPTEVAEPHLRDVFATEKQAKSALAMAQLSQLMKEANGDWEHDWNDDSYQYNSAHVIYRKADCIAKEEFSTIYFFLAFKEREIRDEFLGNHERLIRDYFMMD